MKSLIIAVVLLVSSACHSGVGEVEKTATNAPARFYIVGGDCIVAPGQFIYKEGITITEATKLAGGCKQGALKNKVQLSRDGESRSWDVDLLQIEQGKTNDIRIKPGDYVTRRTGP
jgi:protein involved in polysaccharide export with SLBB domain